MVKSFLQQACEQEKENVFDAMATHHGHLDHKLGAGTANKAARERLKVRWNQDPLQVVSGKTLLSALSAWSQEHYNVAIGAMALARAFRTTEIPEEMKQVIVNIEEGSPFPSIQL